MNHPVLDGASERLLAFPLTSLVGRQQLFFSTRVEARSVGTIGRV
jgi:hypothetical protein